MKELQCTCGNTVWQSGNTVPPGWVNSQCPKCALKREKKK